MKCPRSPSAEGVIFLLLVVNKFVLLVPVLAVLKLDASCKHFKAF